MSKFVGIDFDGTIVEDEFPKVGKTKRGALRTIKRIMNSGNYVVIWTCRDYGIIQEFIDKNFHPKYQFNLYVNENPPQLRAKWGNDPRKIGVDLFIDDKNIYTTKIDWSEIDEELVRLGYITE